MASTSSQRSPKDNIAERWGRLLFSSYPRLRTANIAWPTMWTKRVHLGQLQLSSDHRTVTYAKRRMRNSTVVCGTKNPVSLLSDQAIPRIPVYYFEIRILKGAERSTMVEDAIDYEEKEEEEPNCRGGREIRIGLGERYSVDTAMSGDSFDSFGYSDGVFHSAGTPTRLKERRAFHTGDVIGCGFAAGKGQLLLTYNGEVETVVACPAATVHPIYARVGLRGDVQIQGNFGQEPFAFGVAAFLNANPSITSAEPNPWPEVKLSTPGLTPAQQQCREEQLAALYPVAVEHRWKLPSCWDRNDHKRTLAVSDDNLTITGLPEASAELPAAIRADCCVPEPLAANNGLEQMSCCVYYYELRINNLGINNGGLIGFGYGLATAHLGCMVGSEYHSMGMQANNCRIYCNSKRGAKLDDYTQPFRVCDVMGCGLDFVKGECFFTLNGKYLGGIELFPRKVVKGDGDGNKRPLPFFPIVSLGEEGAEVTVNFGQEEFSFPIKRYNEIAKSPHITREEIQEFRQLVESRPPENWAGPSDRGRKKKHSHGSSSTTQRRSVPQGIEYTTRSSRSRPSLVPPSIPFDPNPPKGGHSKKRNRSSAGERSKSDEKLEERLEASQGWDEFAGTPMDMEEEQQQQPSASPTKRSWRASTEDSNERVSRPSCSTFQPSHHNYSMEASSSGTLSIEQKMYGLEIAKDLQAGRIATALQSIQNQWPASFLSTHPALHFHLKLHEYVEAYRNSLSEPSDNDDPDVQFLGWDMKPSSSHLLADSGQHSGPSPPIEQELGKLGRVITRLSTQLDANTPGKSEMITLMNRVLLLPCWDRNATNSVELLSNMMNSRNELVEMLMKAIFGG